MIFKHNDQQGLPIKDNTDPDDSDDDGYTPATEVDNFHLLTFLRAVANSNENQ